MQNESFLQDYIQRGVAMYHAEAQQVQHRVVLVSVLYNVFINVWKSSEFSSAIDFCLSSPEGAFF